MIVRTRQWLLRRRAVAVLLASLSIYLVVRTVVHPSMIDFEVYRLEGLSILHGGNLYGDLHAPQNLRATYPPFAALIFVPLTAVSPALAQVFFTAANLALVWVVAWQSCRLVGVHPAQRTEWSLMLAALSLWAEPIYTTLGNGQVNLALLVLVLSDFTRSGHDRWQGVGVGIAAGFKVTPIAFLGYLLITRRYRQALTALAMFLATVAASAVVAPVSTLHFWTRYIVDTARVGDVVNSTNQSLAGLVSRVEHTNRTSHGVFATSVVVVVGGLLAAAWIYRRLGDAWGLPVCAVAGLVGAPIAWTHHWVWCVPIAVLLFHFDRRWAAATLVFWTFALFYLPHTAPSVLRFSIWKTMLTGWYVLFGAAFVGFAVSAAHGQEAVRLPNGRCRSHHQLAWVRRHAPRRFCNCQPWPIPTPGPNDVTLDPDT